jgi:hypothetical protein
MLAVKRLVPWVLGLYIVAMGVFTVSGVGQLGFYFDEYVHLNKMQTYLDYGVYLMNASPPGSTELVKTQGHLYVYGPLFSLVAHAVAVLVGAETWGTISASSDAFAVRHYVVAAFSFLGVFATAWGVKLVTRSLTWGLSAAAVLMSIPLWTGSAMYNIKDVAPASGFTLMIVGLIAWSLASEHRTRWTQIGGWLAVYFGTLLMWGIRPGLWPAIALGFLGLWLVLLRLSNFRGVWSTVKGLITPALAVVASYLTMLLIYPGAFINPIYVLYKSFAETSSFPMRRTSMTDGVMPSIPPSWDFLPRWMAAQLPEVLFVLVVMAAAIAVWLVLRRLFQSATTTLDYAMPAIVLTFIQFAAFPVAAILLQSRITSGLRQFLFVFPGLVMLVFIVLFIAKTHWGLARVRGVWTAAVAVVAASTIVTTGIQVQLFPYVANYFNPTAFARGIEGRWELDRYQLHHAEQFSGLSQSEREHCERCDPTTYPDQFVEPDPDNNRSADYGSVVFFSTTPARREGCTVIGTVTRPYLWDSLTLGTANECSIDVEPFVDAPENTEERATWWRKLARWGWAGANSTGLTSIQGSPSAIAFRADPESESPTQVFVLAASVTGDFSRPVTVTIHVNGKPFDALVVESAEVFTVDLSIPRETVLMAPDGRIVVEIELSDGSGKSTANQLVVSKFQFLVNGAQQ